MRGVLLVAMFASGFIAACHGRGATPPPARPTSTVINGVTTWVGADGTTSLQMDLGRRVETGSR
jgi:hypothetical protein